jgi:hypothetical protein
VSNRNDDSPEVNYGPMQYADANPTEERLSRFSRLAKLKLDSRQAFDRWTAANDIGGDKEVMDRIFKVWEASREAIHLNELFDCVRTAAVFDESFRLPQLTEGLKENVEQKFAKLMARIVALALIIQNEQESSITESSPCPASLLQ